MGVEQDPDQLGGDVLRLNRGPGLEAGDKLLEFEQHHRGVVAEGAQAALLLGWGERAEIHLGIVGADGVDHQEQ